MEKRPNKSLLSTPAMKYLTREASQQPGWQGRSRWDSLWKRYAQELARTRDQLTAGWQQLADVDIHLHDTSVAAVEHPSSSEVILCFGPYSKVSELRFLGVRDARIPDSVAGDTWLWAEVHLTPDGCGDLQVLLVKSRCRFLLTMLEFIRMTTRPNKLLQQRRWALSVPSLGC